MGAQGLALNFGVVVIRVTDIKQYVYCPRIVFYTYCMPVRKRTTFKMDLGTDVHGILPDLERRRKLKKYGLSQGQRVFDEWFTSERLGLSGKVDMLIVRDREVLPVDFKYTTGSPSRNHRYQLAGYALLAEEAYGRPAGQGFIYLIPAKDAIVCDLDDDLKAETSRIIHDIEEMICAERMPGPTRQRGKCYDCEHLNFCSDVL